MNTETGVVYRTPEAIAEAQARGEPLAYIGPRVDRLLELGRHAEQRLRDRAKRKRKRKQQQQSRRRNRR